MKKLFVLFLCLAAVAGFVVADDYRPPGAPALELPGHGVGCEAVIPDTILAVAPFTVAEPVSFQAVMEVEEEAIQSQIVLIITVDRQLLPEAPAAGVDYPLRL
ncbi:MAG: hypothetical protein LBK63_08440 [Treponema sp.]|nr:hypothetical protein [Treponema sp.]